MFVLLLIFLSDSVITLIMNNIPFISHFRYSIQDIPYPVDRLPIQSVFVSYPM